MKISYKILAIIIVVSILLLSVGNIIFSSFFLSFLSKEESNQIKTSIDSFTSNLSQRQSKYFSIAGDWGHWDETYDYINSKDPQYEKSNLNEDSISTLDINIMIIYDEANKIIKKLNFDLENKKFLDFPQDLKLKIEKGLNLTNFKNESSFIINYENNFYIISTSLVTDSLKEKPANGIFVVGKLIDKNMIADFEKITGSSITFYSIENINSDLQNSLIEKIGNNSQAYISINNSDKNIASTYLILPNLINKHDIVIKFDKTRSFYLSGINHLDIFKSVYSFFILLILIILFVIINIYISKPILNLAKTLKNINLKSNQFSKIPNNKSYELGIIIEAINNMLKKIEIEHKNLKISENRLISAQSMAHIGNWELNVATKELWASKEAFNIYGIESDLPYLPLDLAQKCVLSEYRDALDKALLNLISKQEKYDLEFKIKCLSTGEEKFVHSNAVLLVDENDNSAKVVGTIQDITNYKKAQEKIEYISYHNALTGLYNRRKFEIDLEKTNKSGIYPVSIIMGDINGLKLVNDAFGHNNGDKLLKKMAQILKDECGDNASVARHGGDEFAVILPNTSYDEAYLIVNNIKNRCDSETTNKLVLNISIGIATKSEKNDDLYKCYRLAEERMYASKLLEAKSTRSAIITNLRTAMEEKTGETKRHSERTAKLAEKMGELLGMQSFEIEFLKLLAILHDIGKTGIPDNILLKPSPLNDEEWKAMKRHCEIGFRIASTMPELVSIAEAILSHHESWDGSGYPHNLKGEEIPLMSRIIAVIDSFDAMTNDRPYKKAISKEEAVEKLLQGSGTQFDPSIVDLFVNKALND